MFKLDLEKAEEPEVKLPTYFDHRKSKKIPEKHLLLLYWLRQNLWLCGLKQTVEHSFLFIYLFLFIIIFLFVVNFVIHWNETAMGLHVFPIPIPPPTSLSTRSL